jgi:hypothetical protein
MKRKNQVTKINRRNNVKYAALKPEYNLKTRKEEIEDIASYANKLSPKDKEWLNKFVEEEINADFRHNRKLNKTKASRRIIYTRNNARNRDVFSRAKAQGKLISLDSIYDNGGNKD